MNLTPEIVIEIWGDLACFTRPECKVERMSYPVPTPSAVRGILNAIYSKPVEFYWQVMRIEVLNPIRYISFKRNEVKNKISCHNMKESIIYVDDTEDPNKGRTQRQTVMLRDVRYRIAARIVRREDNKNVTDQQLYDQALRRIRTGKCFYQPSLGVRECTAYYEESDGTRQPVKYNDDLGLMLYDVFDLHDCEVRKVTKPYITLYRPKIKDGVIEVPDFDSPEVLKPGGADA